MLPDDSKKYMKTIVAYANTSGGKIIVGVDDTTRSIVGVGSSSVFQIMDKIVNAVSDMCAPQIVPNVTFQTIEGKSYDEIVNVEIDYDEKQALKLCNDIRRRIAESKELSISKVGEITITNLENWGILKKNGQCYLPTNAFILCTNNTFRFAKIQCALFKGEDRAVFIDRREFAGSIYDQIEEAYHFVLKHINLGATIDGIVWKDKYELPPESIWEAIINSVCHRCYLDHSCVQIFI